MSGVNAVNGSSGVGYASLGSLSPEMLLAYMRGNLEGLDEQIAGALRDMNARRERTAQLTDILNQLREIKQEAANNGQEGEGVHNDGVRLNRQDEQGRWVKSDANHEIRDLLAAAGLPEADIDRMVGSWGHHANMDEVETAVQRVSDEIGKLNNENEYETLRINDLMGKRSQMIQMVSKMMANMDETARAVIQNMR